MEIKQSITDYGVLRWIIPYILTEYALNSINLVILEQLGLYSAEYYKKRIYLRNFFRCFSNRRPESGAGQKNFKFRNKCTEFRP